MLDLGRYKLTKLIATGGMAKVYNAVDTKGEFDDIAAKVPLDFVLAQPQYLKRFQNEAKISLKFKHPNIMRMYDAGTHDGMPYMIMEFIDGMALEDLQEEKKIFTVDEAVPLIMDLLDAIKHMHNFRDEDIKSSIVHRDLSPQNVIIRKDGRVVLMDFGIAKTKSLTSVTMGTATIGKPYYMAPEQVQSKDSSNIDKRADIYAVGVMLYEMLTGKKPFEGSNPFQVMEKVRNPRFAARPPHEINPSIPKGISEIIMRTMHKNREQRFQSAEELMSALKKGRDTSEAKKMTQIIAAMVALAFVMIITGITGLVHSIKTRNLQLAAIPLEYSPQGVTSESSVRISGWGLPDTMIRVYNRDKYQDKMIGSDGYFSFDNIELNEGENVLRTSLYTLDDQIFSNGEQFSHIILDTTKPEPPTPGDFSRLTRKSNILLSGTVEPGCSIAYLERKDSAPVIQGPFKQGTFEFKSSELKEGSNVCYIYSIDPAGNTCEAVSIELVRDVTPPAPPVFKNSSFSLLSSNLNITGRAEPFSDIMLSAGDMTIKTKADLNGLFQADTTPLLSADSIVCTASDPAGNTSDSSVRLKIRHLDDPDISFTRLPFYTSEDSQSVTLTAVPEASVEIFCNENSVTAKCDSSGSFSTALSLNPGINTVSFRINDDLFQDFLIFRDNTPPVMPKINTPVFSGQSPVIKGNCEPLASLTLSRGVSEYTTQADEKGDFIFKSIKMEKGENTFSLTVTDRAKNSSFFENAFKITLDDSPPVVNLKNIPKVLRFDVFDLVGECEADSRVSLVFNEKTYRVKTDSKGIFKVPGIRIFENRENKFSLTAVDRAGNASVKPVEISISLDVMPPAAPVVAALPKRLDKTRSVDISGTAEKDTLIRAEVVCYNEKGPYNYRTQEINTDDKGNFLISELKLNVGKNTVYVTSSDKAGNLSKRVSAGDVTVDLTLPDAPRFNLKNNYFCKPSVDIPVISVPESKVILVANAKKLEALSDKDGNALVKGVTLVEGKNNVQITCIDSTGLESPETFGNVFLDLQKPDKPKLAKLMQKTSKNSLTIDGTVSEPCKITLEVNSSTEGDDKKRVTTKKYSKIISIDKTKGKSKSFDFKFLSVALSEGSNSITAWATDAAGNESEKTNIQKIILDTIPPAPPELKDIPGEVEKAEIDVIGTAEPESSVTIYVNDDRFETSVGSAGSFSKTIKLKEGNNSITATAKDKTGNESGISKAFTIICSIPPEPPVFSSLPSSIPESQLIVTGIAEKNSKIHFKINDKKLVQDCTDGEFSCKITLVKGKNILSAFTEDSFGNRSASTKEYEIFFERIGIINVDSSPSSADLYIDGVLVGTTPVTSLKVTPGTLNFELRKQAYNIKKWTKTIKVNDKIDFSHILDQQMLPLNIDTQPPGADVYIDGTLMGKTPFRSRNIPAGTHEMLLRLTNYIEKSHRFDLLENNEFSFNFDLDPVMAVLRLTSNVDGAKVVINNKKKGVTPLSEIKLPLGEHMIVVTKPGYTSFKRRITIDSEEEVTLKSNLKKQEYHIEVKCKISGATVYLNDQKVGVTPIAPIKVQSAGEYILSVEKEGYRPYKRTVDIFETGYTTKTVRLFEKRSLIVERKKAIGDREMREVYDDGDNSIWLARDIKLTDKEVKGVLELSKNDEEDWLKIIFDSSGYFYASLKGDAMMQLYLDDESLKIGSAGKSASRIQMDSGQILYIKVFKTGEKDIEYTLINSFRAHSTGDGF
jgi:predicted Ser/Thr protein kinase